jgi:hypothetical protein
MRKYYKVVSTVLVIGFILFWIIWTEYKAQVIKQNFILTTGQINGITKETYKNRSKSVKYSYKVAGVTYNGESGINPCKNMSEADLRALLVNQSFFIAYQTTDIKNSSIIVSQEEAETYNCELTNIQKQIDSILFCR